MWYIHFQWVYMTVKRTEKNPSFPWCIQQPKVLLSMQWHQPSDLQHLAWWLSVNRLYFPQTVSKHDSLQQHKDVSGVIELQKKKKKVLCSIFALFCVCLSQISSLFLVLPFVTQQKHTFLPMDYQFYHKTNKPTNKRKKSLNWFYWNILRVSCFISLDFWSGFCTWACMRVFHSIFSPVLSVQRLVITITLIWIFIELMRLTGSDLSICL